MQVNNILNNFNLPTGVKTAFPYNQTSIGAVSATYQADSVYLNTKKVFLAEDPYNTPPRDPKPINPELKLAMMVGIPTLALGTAGFLIGNAMGSALAGTLIGAAIAPVGMIATYLVLLIRSHG